MLDTNETFKRGSVSATIKGSQVLELVHLTIWNRGFDGGSIVARSYELDELGKWLQTVAAGLRKGD